MTPVRWRSVLLSGAGGLLLLAACWTLSPEIIARSFSSDGRLGGYVAARINALRLAGAGAALLLCLAAALPEARRRRLREAAVEEAARPAWTALAFAAIFAFLWTELGIAESEPCAEGTFTYGAWRASLGRPPCGDFFSYVLPGWHYGLGALFKLFGPSLTLARLVGTVAPKFISTILLYVLARRFLSRPAGIAAAFLGLLFWSANPDNAQAHNAYVAILFGLAALPLLLRWADCWEPRWLVGAGLAAGAGAIVRQDFGLYAFLTAFSFIVLSAVLQAVRERTSLARGAGIGLLWFLTPWSLVVGGAAAAMALTVEAADLHECYIGGPLKYMANYSPMGRTLVPFLFLVRRLPDLSAGQALAQALIQEPPLLLLWASLAFGAWGVWTDYRHGRLAEAGGLLPILFLWTGFFSGHVLKGGANSYAGSGPGSILLLALALQRCRLEGSVRWRRPVLAVGLAALAGFGTLRLFFRPLAPPQEAAIARTPVGDYLCADARRARDIGAAIAHVRTLVPEGEPILVHNPLKRCNNILFYFLAQRPAATRYIEYLPGLETEPETQSRMIADLVRVKPKLVVENVLGEDPQGGRLSSSGPKDSLDGYILAHYSHDRTFGPYLIWRILPCERSSCAPQENRK